MFTETVDRSPLAACCYPRYAGVRLKRPQREPELLYHTRRAYQCITGSICSYSIQFILRPSFTEFIK